MTDTSLVFNILAKDKASAVFGKVKQSAAVAGLAIGAALGVGVTAGLEKSGTDAMLAAQLGATGSYATNLGKSAGEMYANGFGATLADSSNAIKAAVQNGLVGPGALTKDFAAAGAQVSTLATLMEDEAGRVASAVSQMLRTGLAKSATEAFDILAKGTQMGVNKSGDLLDTFNEYGTQFRKLGLDGPKALGLMSQAIKAGARDADTAADALKEFSIRAVDGSKLSATGFKMLGLDAKKMTSVIAKGGPGASAALGLVLDKLRSIKDPALQSQAAVALFGTKAEDLGASLLAMDTKTAVTGLGNVSGAAKVAADTLGGSAQAKLDGFGRKAKMALVDQLAKAVPYIDATFGWLARNQNVVGPIAIGLGILLGGVYLVIGAMKVWTAVQTVLNLVMSMNPVGLIIIAIAALIAIIVLIATKTTWFQDLWAWAWGGIQAAAMAVGNWFSGTLWPWLKAVFIGIGEVLTWPTRFAIEKFTELLGWFKTLPAKIGSAFARLGAIIIAPFKWAFNKVASFWNNGPGKLSFTVPSWVPGIGGKGFSLPKLPMLAKGGNIMKSGAAIVGERGPEILHLNRGAQVSPLSGGGRGMGGELVIRLVGGSREFREFFRSVLRQNPDLLVVN